jgi:hypothetical protein
VEGSVAEAAFLIVIKNNDYADSEEKRKKKIVWGEFARLVDVP